MPSPSQLNIRAVSETLKPRWQLRLICIESIPSRMSEVPHPDAQQHSNRVRRIPLRCIDHLARP